MNAEIEGAIDYALDVPIDRNPYDAEEWPSRHEAWDAGWREAASIYPPRWLENRREWAKQFA